MITTMFGSRATADFAKISSEGIDAWARLAYAAVDENADQTVDELRAAAPHFENMATRELIDMFTADCMAVREVRDVEADIERYRRQASKARKPDTIMADICKLEEQVDKLKAEHELSDSHVVGAATRQMELRRLLEANPRIGGHHAS